MYKYLLILTEIIKHYKIPFLLKKIVNSTDFILNDVIQNNVLKYWSEILFFNHRVINYFLFQLNLLKRKILI